MTAYCEHGQNPMLCASCHCCGSDVHSPVPQRCQECGATDDLIGVPGWNGSPANPGPLDYFCRDIRACYDRAGLPL